MSFLAPLFLVGLVALCIPILLHLRRRRPQAEQLWSDLRFVPAAAPRAERRRNVERWLLLLLRAGAVALLAAAFARPFVTRALPEAPTATGARRLLLIDTSASMQREGLFAAALARARSHLRAGGPGDRLALVSFNRRAQVEFGFEQWAAAGGEAASRLEARLEALRPGWHATDLGAALVAAAEAMVDDEAISGIPAAERTVVLLSDRQEGARLGALGPSEWPAGVKLVVETLGEGTASNLSVTAAPTRGDGLAIADAAGDSGAGAVAPTDRPTATGPQVRLAASRDKAFTAQLRWQDGGPPTEVAIPAGETRVVAAPERPAGQPAPGLLLLEGDSVVFDNQLAIAPPVPTPTRIVYIGNDKPTEASGAYFVSRAFPATRTRATTVDVLAPTAATLPAALAKADLVVLTDLVPPAALTALRAHLGAGRALLLAPRNAAAGQVLDELTPTAGTARWSEAAAKESVLTAVDLSHPLLAPFAESRSADFSRIRFWRHRRLELGPGAQAQVLARFDDGTPAWLMMTAGKGALLVMTANFSPDDSQLALSSKLVPLLWRLLEWSTGAIEERQLFVGDPLPLPNPGGDIRVQIQRPDGRLDSPPVGTAVYGATDLPGLYSVRAGGTTTVRAVNLAPSESALAPLPLEALERLGVAIEAPGEATARRATTPDEAARKAAFTAALEGEQKGWRWPLAAVLLLLLVESLVIARAGTSRATGVTS